MNPILIVGAFALAVLLWLLLAFMFKPIGALFSRLWGDAVEAMNDENKEEKEKYGSQKK